jgi:hypothetical protein
MAAPIDTATMIGRRFGDLVIVEARERATWGGKTLPTYLCRCDCGNEQVVHHYRLHGAKQRSLIRACDECRYRRECVVCGATFRSVQYKTSCSPACLKEYKRLKDLESYYRRAAADPDFNRRAYERAKQALAADPQRAAEYRQKEIARSRRRRAAMTPEQREQERSWRREHYRANAEAILAKRKERVAAMPPAARATMYARAMQTGRDWYQRNREDVRARHQAIIDANHEGWRAYQRKRWRIRAQLRAQAELNELADKLAAKLNPED